MAKYRIANSMRLILAMFHLYAGIETDFGKAITDILKRQFPDQDLPESPAQIGSKLMNIARKQLRGNDTEAMDAIQDLLTYLATGSRYETDSRGVIQRNEDGKPIERTEAKPWDFAKDWKSPKDALGAIYSNLKSTAMSRSMGGSRRQKKERGIDESFGRKTDDGKLEDAESRIPTDSDTPLGQALDDKAALKEFYELIDEHLGDLKSFLTDDSRKLFELIFEDEIGDFGSDVKANMGQATALKEKYPDLYESKKNRWSGFVGDLRKKLLKEIWDYIEQEMSHKDFERLRDQFFSDADPSAVRRMERQKEDDKSSYQRMLDENKISRLKAKQDSGTGLSKKEQGDFDRLKTRLESQGVDVDAIKADASAGAKSRKKKDESEGDGAQQMASNLATAALVSSSSTIPAWAK